MSYPSLSFVTEVTITPSATAYTDGDVVGGLLAFPVNNTAHDGGILSAVTLIDEEAQNAALDLFLFDQLPSTIANDAAFAPTLADLKKLVTKVALASASYGTENSMGHITVEDINIPFPTKNAYGYLVCNGSTPDYNGSDIFIRLFFAV